MQIKLTIKGQKLAVCQETIAEQTIDYLEAEATFSSEWNGLTKFVHFTKGEENYVIMLENDKITKDMHLNLSKGEWIISLHGNQIVEGEVVERITTTVAQLYVKSTGNLNGEIMPDIPPTVAEQILAKAQQALETSESAKEESSEALDKANEVATDLESEIARAKAREDEIESKIPSHDNFATKQELQQETNRAITREDEIEGKIPSIEGLASKQELQQEANQRQQADNDLSNDIDELATIVDDKANKSDVYNKQEVDSKIAQATPQDYDQVKEQVQTNKAEITILKATKVDKVIGKGLSTNDFTNEEKSKLGSLENYDDSEIKGDIETLTDTVESLEDKVGNLIKDDEVTDNSTWSSQKIADTRMAVDMSNIDNAGINKVKDIIGEEGYATELWVNNVLNARIGVVEQELENL